ncbi:ribosome-associated heat shock protein Hsp15 [Peteryoungia aggregata LMG 23059]|uniref:Ribosome-associated heat shock protein Hsp15 n=1 Tax=Peteryoungia aggregata LMG 23059 TaxID=1368425 RepID=A0ABU0G5V5_9HYPH|nr:RNA-binding S4 domain-containing protein [Peteryoungia aggregata]MDQ0420673.1 ribosome-associated heat shock protein Hsp15 [Peteryoungia aggregata LMG 23059]
MDDKQSQSGSRQRIDKWLFFARVAKSRSLAQERVASGHISVNGQKIRQVSHQVKPGDKLEIAMPERHLVLVVKLPGERRGPYEEAKLLYEDLTPPPEKKPFSPSEPGVRAPGAGRPTKKERRALDELRGEPDWLAD